MFVRSCSFTSDIAIAMHLTHAGKFEPCMQVMIVAVAGGSKSDSSRCLPQAMQ